MADAPSLPEWEKILGEAIGSDARCLVCGQWVPPYPVDQWLLVVGEDDMGVVHNYQDSPCLVRKTDWTLCLP